MNRPVFIIISRTRTRIGKAIRKWTGYPFNHCSVSFDPGLSVMYTFARIRKNSPFVGGFIEEYPSRMLDGGGDIPVRIYALYLPDREYERVYSTIEKLKQNRSKYDYNLLDAAADAIGKSCRIPYSYTCLSFVCKLMHLGNIRSVKELEDIMRPYLVYNGLYNDIVSGSARVGGANYFTRVPITSAAAGTAKELYRLVKRKMRM